MIGRVRDTGAPLGGTDEFEDPRYDLDPHGTRVPLDAHIRLANPRTSATANERILGAVSTTTAASTQPDTSIKGSSSSRSTEAQTASSCRPAATEPEPMIDYITPVGGGYFFVPPASHATSDFVGSGLFA